MTGEDESIVLLRKALKAHDTRGDIAIMACDIDEFLRAHDEKASAKRLIEEAAPDLYEAAAVALCVMRAGACQDIVRQALNKAQGRDLDFALNGWPSGREGAVARIQGAIAAFEDEVAEEMGSESGERADLWPRMVEVKIADLKDLLGDAR